LGLLLRMHLDEGQYEGAAELAGELQRVAPDSEHWHHAWEKLEATGFLRTDAGAILPPGMEEEFAATQEAADDLEALAAEAGFEGEEELEPSAVFGEVEGTDSGVVEMSEAERASLATPAEALDTPAEETADDGGEEGEEKLFDLRTDLDLDFDDEPLAEAVAEPEPEAEQESAAAPPSARKPRASRDVDAMLASLASEVLPKRRVSARPEASAEPVAEPEPPAPALPAEAPPPAAVEPPRTSTSPPPAPSGCRTRRRRRVRRRSATRTTSSTSPPSWRTS
ncbi:MAG TPA: hypothetical protein VKU40_08850, partial [Thermoanaerobaculia bacterium]|nr:hypothetical protein [Thermoanaerobaculia bacterium]